MRCYWPWQRSRSIWSCVAASWRTCQAREFAPSSLRENRYLAATFTSLVLRRKLRRLWRTRGSRTTAIFTFRTNSRPSRWSHDVTDSTSAAGVPVCDHHLYVGGGGRGRPGRASALPAAHGGGRVRDQYHQLWPRRFQDSGDDLAA